MNKIQKLSFHSIDDFLAYLPENERLVVDYLRQLIFECIPNCREKLAYNVPFYYRHARICFLWPASVPWGKVEPNSVQLGFCRGNLLRDEINYLARGNRQQVYSRTFTTVKEIEPDLVRTYLFEAVAVDDAARKAKNRNSR